MGADGGRNNPAVTDYGWGKQTAVEDWLFAEGHRFDFFQAVRLLEIIQTLNGERLVPPGQSADPAKEIVHFRSEVKLDFPSSDVAQVTRTRDIPTREQPKAPAEMAVNFLGLDPLSYPRGINCRTLSAKPRFLALLTLPLINWLANQLLTMSVCPSMFVPSHTHCPLTCKYSTISIGFFDLIALKSHL